MSNSYKEREIFICRGTGCNSSSATEIHDILLKLIQEHDLSNFVKVKLTGCHGFCQVGPIMIVRPENVMYVKMQINDIEKIVEQHFKQNKIIERLLYQDPITGKYIENRENIKFYSEQTTILLKNLGKINPEAINDYIDVGGYSSLKKVIKNYTTIQVIEEIKKSRLRGRGGAGFSTGQKWQFCHDAIGSPKYLICNGDEGDPGAYMDRSILESDPHSVIEGMIIAAYAIGANQGFIYTRAEYPLAIERFQIALNQAMEHGYLGKNILNSGFNFDIQVRKGAGAFVCGEETALIASIMGKRGNPIPRPPYPAVSGLWGKPTNINNVKTLATVPKIIEKGADWYSSIGTEDASGTIVFAITGKIENSGLVEIPMGTTLKKLIYDIGGGIPNGKKFKAVQIGGPSGGCIPAKFQDIKMDYASLTSLGAIMGSGGIIVLDEDSCMVDIARYFISFTQKESCGKCVPCREGIKQMFEILTDITKGNANGQSLELLKELSIMIKDTSLCGLGQTAPNPVLSTIRYFEDEYFAHIKDKKCPAGVCKALIKYKIDAEKCQGCGLCKKNCPQDAIVGELKQPHSVNQELCIKCGVCQDVCKFESIITI